MQRCDVKKKHTQDWWLCEPWRYKWKWKIKIKNSREMLFLCYPPTPPTPPASTSCSLSKCGDHGIVTFVVGESHWLVVSPSAGSENKHLSSPVSAFVGEDAQIFVLWRWRETNSGTKGLLTSMVGVNFTILIYYWSNHLLQCWGRRPVLFLPVVGPASTPHTKSLAP